MLLAEHAERWDWERLSANPQLPWSRQLLQNYAPHWNWATLSALRQLPWDIEFFSAFAQRWFIPLVVEHQHFDVHAMSADQISMLLPEENNPA
jgi:hypothetical protein